MATVTIDISEYDMLRNGKEQAEAEVKTLKEDIKGLKDKSRVIITTITKVKERSTFSLYTDEYKTISTSESTQFTNFDDIEFEIREKLAKKVQKELDEQREFFEQARKHYEEKKVLLEPDLKKKFEEDKDELIQEYEKKLVLLKNSNECLNEEIHTFWRPELEKAQENLGRIPNWIKKLFGVKLQA